MYHFLSRFVPEYFRVAEVFQSVERGEDGVALVLGVGAAVVGAVSHALDLSVLVAGRGVEGNQSVLAVAGAVVVVDYRAAREDVPQGVAGDGRCEVFPVDEVFAHRVAPVHVAPLGTVGVVLEIEVILAVFVDQTVGIVHPAVERGVVVDGAVVVACWWCRTCRPDGGCPSTWRRRLRCPMVTVASLAPSGRAKGT